ncbi:RasGEF domain containing protein [Tritrichomonas foetus]|uniref:RasGEF domain containing protein n=1 Tax=Tritrichomonas foetus TaxID=1144522 RepID=A0A1J4JQR2_9EUKA|nr:RasGEF domain containing protein [Tritrichomonas foetus]|eukprot:OHT01511.1 RasGEF domain containing protein [Tritrichomonas foetus]
MSTHHKSQRDETNPNDDESSTLQKVPAFNFKFKSQFKPRESKSITSNIPFHVSPEFDGKNSKSVKSEYDRSYWEVELLRRHPELKDLIDRVDPVTRAASLAALYLPNRRLHPQEAILGLISQHLKLLGLTQTAAALDDSFAFPIVTPPHHPHSQLLHHIERGVLNADRFWCLLLPTPTYPTDPESIQKQLVTQLNATLGVISGQIKESQPLDKENIDDLQKLEVNPDTQMPINGTINQLVWAASSRYRTFNPQFIEVFSMTYHGYMTSTQLLQKLQEAWNMFALTKRQGDDREELLFVSLVEKWIEISFFDFDAVLLQNLTQFLQTIKMNRPASQKRMLAALQKQIEGKQRSDQVLEVNLNGLSIPENLFLSKFTLTSLDTTELAKQITMGSAKSYYAITAKELLDCAWSKPSIRHRSPNIVNLTNRFNALSDWAQHEILYSETVDERLKLIKFFAALAKDLWGMKNFLDGMSIASALNSNPMYRLKHHMALLDPEIMKPVEEILEATKSDNNFALLLSIHANAKAAGAALPYIGVYLTQLTFFYDGNKDLIDGLVNFNKCVGVFNIIDMILSFQVKQFNFVVIEQIQEKLSELSRYDEGELYARSLQIEPNGIEYDEFIKIVEAERATTK